MRQRAGNVKNASAIRQPSADSCKFCDEIAVFDHGEVIQQGTHERLLADTAGKYYELWNAQAQYYTEEPA